MTKIPYCCLPQESGPCLSPSVAVRPLRPAMHRRLGGPLPHQPANAPQVHPCAEPSSSFNTESMPSLSLSGISFRFRKFSRSHGQVPYVLLTRSPLESRRTLVRLACIRHAASVHPEPGSNSPFDLTQRFCVLFYFLIVQVELTCTWFVCLTCTNWYLYILSVKFSKNELFVKIYLSFASLFILLPVLIKVKTFVNFFLNFTIRRRLHL